MTNLVVGPILAALSIAARPSMQPKEKIMQCANALASALLIFGVSASAIAAGDNRATAVEASLLTAESFGPASSDAQGGAMLDKLVAKWGNTMRNVYGWEEDAVQQFRTGYKNYPEGVLQAALDAPTFQQMTAVLDTFATLQSQRTVAKAFSERRSFALNALQPQDADNPAVADAHRAVTKALGDDAKDLVFVPITPCTVWDTRFATGAPYAGAIGDGVTRRFWSHWDGAGTDFSPYGGNPNCTEANQTFIGGRPFAVMMTVYVNNPVGNGWLTFYRDGDPDPSQATISVYYSPGPTRTQTVITKSNRGYGTGTYDIAVTGRFSTADASASVTGYFIKPQATALDCNDSATSSGTGTANVADNTAFSIAAAPACAAGYTATSVSCIHSGLAPAGLALVQSGGTTGYYACYWRNQTGTTLNGVDFIAKTRCCRTPGR